MGGINVNLNEANFTGLFSTGDNSSGHASHQAPPPSRFSTHLADLLPEQYKQKGLTLFGDVEAHVKTALPQIVAASLGGAMASELLAASALSLGVFGSFVVPVVVSAVGMVLMQDAGRRLISGWTNTQSHFDEIIGTDTSNIQKWEALLLVYGQEVAHQVVMNFAIMGAASVSFGVLGVLSTKTGALGVVAKQTLNVAQRLKSVSEFGRSGGLTRKIFGGTLEEIIQEYKETVTGWIDPRLGYAMQVIHGRNFNHGISSIVVKTGIKAGSSTGSGGGVSQDFQAPPISPSHSYDSFYQDHISPLQQAMENGKWTKELWLEHYDAIVGFVGKIESDLDAPTMGRYAPAIHDNGYWKGESAKVDNLANPLLGGKIPLSKDSLREYLTDEGLEAYGNRYAAGAKGFKVTLAAVKPEKRAEFFIATGKTGFTPEMAAALPASTVIANANAMSWKDMMDDAQLFPDPEARVARIFQNQKAALAATLALTSLSTPLSIDSMNAAVAILWKYTGHWSGKNGWENELLVSVPVQDLSTHEKDKDQPIWEAVLAMKPIG